MKKHKEIIILILALFFLSFFAPQKPGYSLIIFLTGIVPTILLFYFGAMVLWEENKLSYRLTMLVLIVWLCTAPFLNLWGPEYELSVMPDTQANRAFAQVVAQAHKDRTILGWNPYIFSGMPVVTAQMLAPANFVQGYYILIIKLFMIYLFWLAVKWKKFKFEIWVSDYWNRLNTDYKIALVLIVFFVGEVVHWILRILPMLLTYN